MGFASEAEAALLVADMEPQKKKKKKPVPVVISNNVEVARQQLSDLLPKLQSRSWDSEPAQREAARLIRRLNEVNARIKELEEEEEIVLFLTLLH
jgi:predicted transcriptional regulator